MDEFLRADERSIWHPFTPLPHQGPRVLFDRAQGAYVVDAAGKRYFDATSSWWCQLHGHCHPRLVKALKEQAETLDQVLFAPHSHKKAIELSTNLLKVLGGSFSKIFFSDDGSTAVEAALKMSLQYWVNRKEPGRKYFLSLDGAYHGDTLGAVSVSHIAEFHHPFGETIRRSLKCDLKDLNSVRKTLSQKENEIAGLIVEPLIQGAAGMRLYPKEALEELIQMVRAQGIVVIFDEVFTGFGRTGTMFAKDQIEGEPDIICLSKGLTSGMLPLAVTAVNSQIFETFLGEENTFYHGHTFSGNPLSCAVALESLRLFEEEKVLERNRKLIGIMREQRGRFSDLDCVEEVRHLGMIWAVELKPDRPEEVPWAVASNLWEKGFWLRPLDNIIYLVPPYCTTEKELQDLYSALASELKLV